MLPPILAHWGYTREDVDKLTEMLRAAAGSTATGPPTEDEVSHVVMVAVAFRLEKAGYKVALRQEPHKEE